MITGSQKLRDRARKLTTKTGQLKRQLAAKDAEIERLKQVITDVHNLSYPGLAIKESALLNKIYSATEKDTIVMEIDA